MEVEMAGIEGSELEGGDHLGFGRCCESGESRSAAFPLTTKSHSPVLGEIFGCLPEYAAPMELSVLPAVILQICQP
jgi:hypothetical protein